MFANRPLELVHNGAFEPRQSGADHQPVRLQVDHVTEPDDMGDEAQALLACLQLSEQDVVGARAGGDGFQIANVARPAKDLRISDHGETAGRDICEVGDDEVGEPDDRSIVSLDTRLVVED